MHETKMEVKKICGMKEKLSDFMSAIMCSGSCDSMNVEQAGQFIDMIKDLYESEKNAWKACYYKKLVEGMEPPTEEEMRKWQEQGARYGYDNWRYSSGRFAPTGHGHFAGYKMDEEIYGDNKSMMYGYTPGREMGRNVTDYGRNTGLDYRYGKAYRDWDDSRRHYTESKSIEDKDEMDRHAKEHVMDAAASIREMYKAGDPELKKEIKKHLTALIGEMPT